MARQQEIRLFEPSDPSVLEELLRHLVDPTSSGFPAAVEPEPTAEKGRFGKAKERPTGFGVNLVHTTTRTARRS